MVHVNFSASNFYSVSKIKPVWKQKSIKFPYFNPNPRSKVYIAILSLGVMSMTDNF